MDRTVKIGLVGCGNICDIYFTQCAMLEAVEIVACADLELDRAKDKAKQHGIQRACSTEELLAMDDVEIVLNLTVPQAHMPVSMAALEAGKHVYTEKPLTVALEDGQKLLATAEKKGLRIGSAPDTFMGAGLQTCRKLIDDGWIGQPVSATAFMLCPGHESWHPNPEFFYKTGGGPMFDMGPYYLTALVHLLGPVNNVAGATSMIRKERLITSQPFAGTKIKVDIPTHVVGVMNFASGCISTIMTSFDVWHHRMPCIEIFGTEGTMTVPDPNSFGGPVQVRRARDTEWHTIPLTHSYSNNSRGIGLADMATGIANGRPHRADCQLAYHVLELMHAFHTAADKGQNITMTSAPERPAALPMNLREGSIDD